MQVVVVGSGGREHALAHALARTAAVTVIPGNHGMSQGETNFPIKVTLTPGPDVYAKVLATEADLFVIGPEKPLVDGLADRLREQGKLVFGPGVDGAQLENSKAWMKRLVSSVRVPTADFVVCDGENRDEAKDFIRRYQGNVAVKTSYLAAGKGSLEFYDDVAGAIADLEEKLKRGAVIVEERLEGTEFSFFAVCDGTKAVPFGSAQDYKKMGDDNRGLNTGGIGAFSPTTGANGSDIMNRFIDPTMAALKATEGIDYRGVLYLGGILTADGPKLLEYNIRMGDPEAQVVLPRLSPDCDLAQLLYQAAGGRLRTLPVFTHSCAVTVVLCSAGYPGELKQQDKIIHWPRQVDQIPGVTVYAADVDRNANNFLVNHGGRVLSVTATAPSMKEAHDRAYEAAKLINWPGCQYRKTIALEVI